MEDNRVLKKSNEEKMIFGVAGGLAEYFAIDPVIVRILFIALLFADGVGFILYIILAIVMPDADATQKEIKEKKPARTSDPGMWRNLFGALLITTGFVLLIEQVVPIDIFSSRIFWPIVILLIGAYMIVSGQQPHKTEGEDDGE